jgi:D-methionine transport system substrate-binding protein
VKKLLLLVFVLYLLIPSPALASAPEALRIGVMSPSPHAELLEFVREDLRALGYELTIEPFAASVLLNPSLSADELEAHFYGGQTPVSDYNAYAGGSEQLTAVIAVHFAPFGLYAAKTRALSDLGEGGVIFIPDDPVGETRALWLLREAGLIELPGDASSADHLTASSVTANPLNLDIRKVKAQALSTAPKDADFTVMSADLALGAGLKPVADAVFLEPPGGAAAKRHADFVVVHEPYVDAGFAKALERVLLTQKVSDFILTSDAYAGGIAPVFPAEAQG